MSKKVYKLKKDQYLSDLELKIIPNQSTFLVAPTGAGKTTYTMEELKAQYKLVIILVPTQAKVMELQNEYSGKGSLKSEYSFFCANENPDENIRTRLNDMYSDKKQVVESALSHLKRGTKDIYDKAAHLKERKSLIQGWSQEIISMFHNNNQGS